VSAPAVSAVFHVPLTAVVEMAAVVVIRVFSFDTAAVIFVFSSLKSGLAARPGPITAMFAEAWATARPVVHVPARGNAPQATRDLASVHDDPAASMIVGVVPNPAHAVPVPAVHEEDLLIVFRYNLHPGADFDQNRRGFKADGWDADLHLQVHLRGAGLGKGD